MVGFVGGGTGGVSCFVDDTQRIFHILYFILILNSSSVNVSLGQSSHDSE